MKRNWEKEMHEWRQQKINDEYTYIWCDGVNVSVRLGEEKKISLLVVIGVNQNGQKKLLAVSSGYKESELGWKEVFLSLEKRGVKSPKLVIGDW